MSRKLRVNRRSVLGAVKSGEVTGRDLRRCAVSIVGVLGVHPVCASKVKDILNKLVCEGTVELRDAQLRLAEWPKPKVGALHAKKKVAERHRTAAKRGGGLRALKPESVIDLDIPDQWQFCCPDDYASKPISPAGGWEGASEVDAREPLIRLLTAEQVGDWVSQGLTPEPGHEDDVRLGLGYKLIVA